MKCYMMMMMVVVMVVVVMVVVMVMVMMMMVEHAIFDWLNPDISISILLGKNPMSAVLFNILVQWVAASRA